ncbi:MAG: DUF4974 domain-containing protein [candidate division Zixibacteria bacterium]|nr:DUF4974 domain-containing protein [candidate division Zixibacteria bacterium]
MDLEKNTDQQFLARYLSGECPEEKPRIEKWLESDPGNQRLYLIMKSAWEMGESQPSPSDLDIMWREFEKKSAIRVENHKENTDPPITYNRFFVNRVTRSPLLRIAAVLLLVVGISLITARVASIFPFGDQLQYVNVTVENGTHLELTLSDGTAVVLDAGSTFRYPEEFGDLNRIVFLNGEAYFDVAHDSGRPFVVQSHTAKISVVGTKFNIRGWGLAEDVRVVVAEGTVSLQPVDYNSGDSVVISKGQMSVLKPNESPSSPRPVDVSKHLGWMRNDIIFDDAPIYEVLDQIERWYNVKISLSDPSIRSERISVNIKKKSLTDVLDLLSALTGLPYEYQGREVKFYR